MYDVDTSGVEAQAPEAELVRSRAGSDTSALSRVRREHEEARQAGRVETAVNVPLM